STGPSGAVTAARCASFSGLRMGDKSMGGAFYTVKTRAYGKGPKWAGAETRAKIGEPDLPAWLGGGRHALPPKARQRDDEAQQHGPYDEPEDPPRGCAADRADEQRERGHLGVMRGKDRPQQILGNPQQGDPDGEKYGAAPASLKGEVQHGRD